MIALIAHDALARNPAATATDQSRRTVTISIPRVRQPDEPERGTRRTRRGQTQVSPQPIGDQRFNDSSSLRDSDRLPPGGPAHQRFKPLAVRAAPIHPTTAGASRKRAIGAEGSRLKFGRDLGGRDPCEECPAAQAPRPWLEPRGEPAEDLIELRVDVARADESSVVHDSAKEHPAIPGEQLPALVRGPRSERQVVDVRVVGRIDAEQAHPSRQRAEVDVEQETTRTRLWSFPCFDGEHRRVSDARRAKSLVADPLSINGCRTDFRQWQAQDLKEVCHRFRWSCVTHGVVSPVPPRQEGPKHGIDLDDNVRHSDIVPAQGERSLDPGILCVCHSPAWFPACSRHAYRLEGNLFPMHGME